MKLERAQELYSDYAEGTLTPALRQALEQHFEADPAARDDYDSFTQFYSLLEASSQTEIEVPLGFRSKILERAAAEQGKRETTFHQRPPSTNTWFQTLSHRRATGGIFAALAAVAVMCIMLFPHPAAKGPTDQTTFAPNITTAVTPEIVQSIDTQPGQATANHVFHLHLPAAVPSATVNAYVVSATEQITDPAHLADATQAIKDMHLTNHQGVEIPIAPLQAQPAGSTLGLLVQWTPYDTTLSAGSEVVFTPFGAADMTSTAPLNTNLLDALKAAAGHYGVTIVVETDTVSTGTISPDFSSSDPSVPLSAMAKAAGFSVQRLPNNTFYVYDPQQTH